MTRPGACRGRRRGRRRAGRGHRRARPVATGSARRRALAPRADDRAALARRARHRRPDADVHARGAGRVVARRDARRANDVSDSATVNGRPTIEGSRAHGRAESSGQVTTTSPRSERHGRSRPSSSSAALDRSEDQTGSGERAEVVRGGGTQVDAYALGELGGTVGRHEVAHRRPAAHDADRHRCGRGAGRTTRGRGRPARGAREPRARARARHGHAAPLRLRAQSRSRICRSRREAWSCSSRTCAGSFSPRRWPRTARSCSVSWASCSSSGRPSEGSRSVALRHRSRASSTDALPRGTARSRSSSERRAPWTARAVRRSRLALPSWPAARRREARTRMRRAGARSPVATSVIAVTTAASSSSESEPVETRSRLSRRVLAAAASPASSSACAATTRALSASSGSPSSVAVSVSSSAVAAAASATVASPTPTTRRTSSASGSSLRRGASAAAGRGPRAARRASPWRPTRSPRCARRSRAPTPRPRRRGRGARGAGGRGPGRARTRLASGRARRPAELGEARVQCLHGLLDETGLEQDLRAVQPCRALEDVGLELLGASHAGEGPRDVTQEVCGIPLVVTSHELLLGPAEVVREARRLGEGLERLLRPQQLEGEHARGSGAPSTARAR